MKACQALALRSRCDLKRVGLRRFQLQAEVPKDAPPIKGFNVVMQRVANIILNITERQPSNILHAYPESALVSYIGPVTHIDISGLSNANIHHEEFKEKSKYSSIDSQPSFQSLQRLPYSDNKFQMVIHCLPVFQPSPSASSSPAVELLSAPSLSLLELIRITARRGCVVLGCPESIWQEERILQRAEEASKAGLGDMMIVQKLPIPLSDFAIAPASSVIGGDLKKIAADVDEQDRIKYTIGVFRRS